jgi:hypothetical protein
MTLADLSSIAGIVSSLAVCGALIYLALRVRQTDQNHRTLLQQSASARSMESVWRFGEPHNAEIMARVWNGETDFTIGEATQLVSLLRASLLGFQDQFLLNQLTLVHSTQNETQERALRRILSAPALRALWTITGAGYAPEFANYINAVLKDVPLAAPHAALIRDAAAEWKS